MTRTTLREAVTKTVCITSFSEMEFRRREREGASEGEENTNFCPALHSFMVMRGNSVNLPAKN